MIDLQKTTSSGLQATPIALEIGTIAEQVISKLKTENSVVKQGLAQYGELDAKGYSYHNSEHTENVLKTSVTLALLEGIEPTSRKMELVVIAAVYHDLGFIYQQFKNEPVGAEMAVTAMHQQYNPAEIEIVRDAILDTEMKGTPAGGFKQFARTTNQLSGILCDSDTFNLSTESFFDSSIKVYNERFKESPVKNMSELGERENGVAFLKGTLGILNSHEYYTQSAKKLGEDQKNKNKLILEKYIQACEKN